MGYCLGKKKPMNPEAHTEALKLGIGVGSYVFREDNQATALLDKGVIFADPEQYGVKLTCAVGSNRN